MRDAPIRARMQRKWRNTAWINKHKSTEPRLYLSVQTLGWLSCMGTCCLRSSRLHPHHNRTRVSTRQYLHCIPEVEDNSLSPLHLAHSIYSMTSPQLKRNFWRGSVCSAQKCQYASSCSHKPHIYIYFDKVFLLQHFLKRAHSIHPKS
jgi:hypothetical protein